MKIYVRHGNCFVGSEGLSNMARKLKRAAHIRGGGRNKLKSRRSELAGCYYFQQIQLSGQSLKSSIFPLSE